MVIIVRVLLSAFAITSVGLFFTASICVRGKDNTVKEELYQGTSKGAEGYAACLTFKKAKRVLTTGYARRQLMAISSDVPISETGKLPPRSHSEKLQVILQVWKCATVV